MVTTCSLKFLTQPMTDVPLGKQSAIREEMSSHRFATFSRLRRTLLRPVPGKQSSRPTLEQEARPRRIDTTGQLVLSMRHNVAGSGAFMANGESRAMKRLAQTMVPLARGAVLAAAPTFQPLTMASLLYYDSI